MINSANKYSISDIFSFESREVIYKIPRYQREYSWGKTQWKNIFDDINDNKEGYFIGSIICINLSKDALSMQELELVDGQQRLITLSLLLAAIFNKLTKYKPEFSDDQLSEYINLKRKLVSKNSNKIRVVPQVQNYNHDDYISVISSCGIFENIKYEIPPNAGNRKILRAFKFFQNCLNELCEENKENNITNLITIFNILDKVNKACLVKIEVDTHADAYMLFESLNNRGMPLTPVDLIKNKLLSSLERNDSYNLDNYFNRWQIFINYLGNDYSIQERFLRQYYNAFNYKFKDKLKLPQIATRSNLIEIYETIIDNDANCCLEELINAANIYSLIISENEIEEFGEIKKSLKDLERIQGSPSYLLLMYLFLFKNDLNLSILDLKLIVDFLVKFFVRRNLTDIPPTRIHTRMFMEIVKIIRNLKSNDNNLNGSEYINIIKNYLINKSASDLLFKEKLNGDIYLENSDVTRFILCYLEESYMNKETHGIDLWETDKKQYIWSIEHIFPQGDNIPDYWVKMIADGDKNKAKEIQKAYVHKLGNLTISGYNSSLSNKSFEDKRDRTDKNGVYIGYKNLLNINRDLAVSTKWTAEDIEKRTNNLVNKVLEVFKLSDNIEYNSLTNQPVTNLNSNIDDINNINSNELNQIDFLPIENNKFEQIRKIASEEEVLILKYFLTDCKNIFNNYIDYLFKIGVTIQTKYPISRSKSIARLWSWGKGGTCFVAYGFKKLYIKTVNDYFDQRSEIFLQATITYNKLSSPNKQIPTSNLILPEIKI